MLTDPRGLLIWSAAVCGVLIVACALYFIYRGVINLDAQSKGGKATEFSISSFIKIKTNIAGLVLFCFALAFFWLAFSHLSSDPESFDVVGHIAGLKMGEHVSVAVCGGPWEVPVQSDGGFNYPIKPDLNHFQVRMAKAGSPIETTFGLQKKQTGNTGSSYSGVFIEDGIANFGDVTVQGIDIPPPTPIDKVTNVPPPAVKY